MAKLSITIVLETSEKYDDAVLESRGLRMRGREGRTAADQLQEQIARHIGGLSTVDNKRDIDVTVATIEPLHHTKRLGSLSTQTSLELDAPVEKRRAG